MADGQFPVEWTARRAVAGLPGDVAREHLATALDQLDEVIREIRDYAFTSGSSGGEP